MTASDRNDTSYADTPSASTNEFITLVFRLLRIFRYRKRVILSTLYCFLLAGGAYYFLAPRYYQSSAKLLIIEQKIDQLSAVGETDNTGNTMATHRELVMSPVVIKNAIKRLAPEHRVDLHGKVPREWVRTITKGLGANITRKTNIIDVYYRSLDPKAAAAVVNAVIQSYLDFVEKNHKGEASAKIIALTTDREKIERDLDEKQKQLQQTRQSIGHLSTSSEDGIVEPLIQRAIHLNDAFLAAQEKRLDLQVNLASIEESLRNGEDISQQLMGIEESLGRQMLLSAMGMSTQDLQLLSDRQKDLLNVEQMLASLSNDYGPNHPRILELRQRAQNLRQYLSTYHAGADARLDSIGAALPSEVIVRMLEKSVRQAQQRETQLQQSFEHARWEAAKHSKALVDIRMLERNITRGEFRYDEISKQIAAFDASQQQAPISATVIREPLPEDVPVSPQLRLVAITCLMGGALFGGLIAYVQDILDDRFNSPEELSTQLGVPVLSIVRKLDPLPGDGLSGVHTNAMPNAVETEAFRTLRTAISVGADVCDRLLISSSEPGDGKTTISANLSVAFAQAGKRTLVIDADLRRPGFTALVDLKGTPGVADVLASEQSPAITAPPLIQTTEVNGLDVLPVGLRRPNPAELLSSKAFVELLAWADSQYDRVIVDCPPVLAVSDAQIVGQLVDGAILVVRPEKNHRRSVMRAVESFQTSGCRVLGVVANGLSSEAAGYGYGGYGYGYGDEYGHSSELAEAPVADTEISVANSNEEMSFQDLPTGLSVPKRRFETADSNAPTIRPRRAA
ncbi:MAG: polysaccharide biosynthesis tyrosine autokinase [Planctomycetota bacterium]